MEILSGMLFENEDMNIFVKRVTAKTVVFIEGFSPSALHDIQEIPKDNFIAHCNSWGYAQNGFFE